jgi:HaeII restriction endonuclease
MNDQLAKNAIDSLIKKARVHLYKPIQIAEILYRDRVAGDIDLANLTTYRNASKRWRDEVCIRFLGRASTSSARFQDDLFNENAIPSNVLSHLGEINRANNGIVEAYIYRRFQGRMAQMSTGLEHCIKHDEKTFTLQGFLDLFWHESGLKRSIDKVYEIVVYSLFSALVDAIGVTIEVSMNPNKEDILREFEDFAKLVIGLSAEHNSFKLNAKIHRVGVTNASDRGLDMFANFGLIIQIKHLSLTEELAEGIANSVTGDRIVIVCKDSEQKLIVSLLTQIGWKARIQSVITENDLLVWYEKALRGKYSKELGPILLENIRNEIQLEFPTTNNKDFLSFMIDRGYFALNDDVWK